MAVPTGLWLTPSLALVSAAAWTLLPWEQWEALGMGPGFSCHWCHSVGNPKDGVRHREKVKNGLEVEGSSQPLPPS